MKNFYLCVDDYGTGGIWYVIEANSEYDINRILPFLKVVNSRPQWMGESEYQELLKTSYFDIESLPTSGMLGLTLQERLKRFKGEGATYSPEQLSQIVNDHIRK